MYRLQRAKLLNKQEQKEDDGTSGDEEVLSPVPAPHCAQGDEIALNLLQSSDGLLAEYRPVAPTGRAPVSKTGCWGFESLLACQHFLKVDERLRIENPIGRSHLRK